MTWKASQTWTNISRGHDVLYITDGACVIGQVWPRTNTEDSRREAAANANKMAAAPKMLEVLESVYHQLATDSDLDSITGAAKYRDLYAMVGRVIAEADPGNPQTRFNCAANEPLDEYKKMRPIRVTWEDGDTTETSINGTKADVIRYYVGKTFNVGRGPDDYMQKAVKVEFLD